jgi:hypothetical protein
MESKPCTKIAINKKGKPAHKLPILRKAGLHKVHCANPGAVIGAVDFNGVWKNSHF